MKRSLCLLTVIINYACPLNYLDYFKYNEYKELSRYYNETDCLSDDNKQFFVLTSDDEYGNKTERTFGRLNCPKESLENEIYFPKCCPLNYFYETTYHRCVKSETASSVYDSLGFSATLIKAGLEKCKVVADHVIKMSEFDGLVNITSDRKVTYKRSYAFKHYCFENVINSDDVVLRVCENIDYCKQRIPHGNFDRCIKKCCPDGQAYIDGNVCKYGPQYGLDVINNDDVISNANESFAILYAEPFRKYLADKKFYHYSIEQNGSIFVSEQGIFQEYTIDVPMYCMENVRGTSSFLLQVRTDAKDNTRYKVSRPALIISIASLLITLIVYVVLSELHNLIGKIIISYCTSLLTAFGINVYIKFNPEVGSFCKPAGFLIMGSFLASFLWSSIMCYDICCTLGSMKVQNSKHKEKRKFILYSLFAWPIPILLTLWAYIDNKYWILPEYLHLYVGETKCFIEDRRTKNNYGYFFYFVGPCGLLIISNLAFFIKTIWYCLRVKSAINKMKTDMGLQGKRRTISKEDKEKVLIIIKLSLLMGVTWMFETLFSIISFKENVVLQYIEMFIDTFNSLQGVFIFCIFTMKMKIFYSLAKTLGFERFFHETPFASNFSTTESVYSHANRRQFSVTSTSTQKTTANNSSLNTLTRTVTVRLPPKKFVRSISET